MDDPTVNSIRAQIIKDEVKNADFLFKVIIIGDTGVGKSCILLRATKDEFKDQHEVTIGAEFGSYSAMIENKITKLQIWDTAGQETFRSMIRVFYKGSHAAIIVYDVTRHETFDKIHEWLTEIRDNVGGDITIILVGNQIDNEEDREVQTEEGRQFAQDQRLHYFIETSAKNGVGIEGLFTKALKYLYYQLANQEEEDEKEEPPRPYVKPKPKQQITDNGRKYQPKFSSFTIQKEKKVSTKKKCCGGGGG